MSFHEFDPSMMTGMRVVVCKWMHDTRIDKVKRTWRERLFTRPWTPLTRIRTVVTRIPRRNILVSNNVMYMHPELFEEYKHVFSPYTETPE